MSTQMQLLFDVPEVQRAIAVIQKSEYDHYLEKMICPLCQKEVKQSDYLASVINDRRVLYLANLVTHYRHNHVKWDKGWKYMQRMNGSNWDYNKAKEEHNERAKRQYIRKCYPVFKKMGIRAEHFMELQNQDPKTITLAYRYL